ncbi:hypothetical protein FH972_009221 [Carpinus fangiana]|uniref:Uncharacterized protein n=1 Tax=Carpinus fangiana TaxID=176857 RepID=A0A5N6R2T7_9ROSI|nr:hypothetical protein FH972_009221 [Carpinus fangiana]
MSRGFGFQQQSYAVQQQSYGVEAAWHSKNQYHDNRFVLIPADPCVDPLAALLKHHNKLSRKHGVHQNGWHHETTSAHYYNNHVSAAGKRLPFNAWNASNFSNDQMEENAEYETSFHEVRVPATVRVQERRYYERSSTWGDDGNPYRSGSYDENISFNGYEWVPIRGL